MGKMNFFQERLGRYFLKSQVKKIKRKLSVSTFDTARNIAIIYYNANKLSVQKVENFAKNIVQSHAGITISLLGFCGTDTKQVLKTGAFPNTFITKNDFTWYGAARNEALEKFIKTPFDILIDLSMEQIFPLEYIVQLSQATFKIGRLNQLLLYDFMIDVKNEENINYLIQQISVYLPSLKQK